MKKTNRNRGRKRAVDPKRSQAEKAWNAADWQYSALVASTMVPLLGKVSPAEEMAALEEIVRLHPDYYPALYHLGGLKVAAGRDSEGQEFLLKAVDLMAKREDPATFDPKSMDNLIEFLGGNLRYDVARVFLERLLERYPRAAAFHDELGAAAVALGDEVTAIAMARKAVELAPGNAHYLANLGWAHLAAGRLDEAGPYLDRSLALMPNNEVTQGNREALRYLQRAGGTFMDFLLRPLDRKRLARLEKKCEREGDYRELAQAAAQWNGDRLLAWNWNLCRRREAPDFPEWYKSLRAFFGFIGNLADDNFLYEDMEWVQAHWGRIMNKFIFKMADADAEIIEQIHAGLFSFYGLLAARGLADQPADAEFRSVLLGMKPGILDKAARYAEIRHNDAIPEAEKERVRGELFGEDHEYPEL